ncbi:MAG TPA: hypothetical protein VM076_13495 [Gemmatimonadaceae bacterium]|nr:hypothetical protein [Gemmatimonadaceae bacterium]
MQTASLESLHDTWSAAWPSALAAWSKFTRLRPPMLCLTEQDARREGLTGSFAMIRLNDQSVVVSLPEVVTCGVEQFPIEVLAHEIGHHVLAPATLTDHGRMIARMRWALPTVEHHAPMVANLYTDILINDRLQRFAGLQLAEVYRRLGARDASGGAVWALYTRIYEILWSLPRGSLGGGATDDRLEGDALLGTRLVRSYARDWLDGSGRFAALLLPHLLEDQKSAKLIEKLLDTRGAAAGGDPAGLVGEDAEERAGAVHPAQDPALNGLEEAGDDGEEKGAQPKEVTSTAGGGGQSREPFQFGELLRAAGVVISDHDAAVKYYRERAAPFLIPFPTRRSPQSTDPLPEGLEPWEAGDALDAVDWLQSVLQSPNVVPGMTTVQRVWGTAEGAEPARVPLDLDLYVDSSGSMPNPQQLTSFPALAGAILCMSALRAGARVQATLWSGQHQCSTTRGFVRDSTELLNVLTGYFGGGTQFPIHVLRETYATRNAASRAVHVLVISDDGVSTMFDKDEKGTSGFEIAAMALKRARGGGSLVLNVRHDWDREPVTRPRSPYPPANWDIAVRRARDEQGWHVHTVASLADLVDFARAFSRSRYADTTEAPR